MRGAWLACLLAGSLALSGCGLGATVRGWLAPPPGPAPDLAQGVQVVDHHAIVEFQQRAQAFYDRLSLRRFNTHASYTDAVLREHFRTPEAFYDYYADLAHSLDQEVLEKNRSVLAEVLEFALEAPGRARVQVSLRGDNGRPLRWWSKAVEREDVWERLDGTWWLVPGKL
jgi:hypothetical protein